MALAETYVFQTEKNPGVRIDRMVVPGNGSTRRVFSTLPERISCSHCLNGTIVKMGLSDGRTWEYCSSCKYIGERSPIGELHVIQQSQP